MSEMHEATPVSQPFLHFERFLDSREAATCDCLRFCGTGGCIVHT